MTDARARARDALRAARREAVPVALGWVERALSALDAPNEPLTRAALATNFAWERVDATASRAQVHAIVTTFEGVRAVLRDAKTLFAAAPTSVARRHFSPPASIPPAYAIHGDRVYVTEVFSRFGPKCRAAMALHESVHLVDPGSGAADVHVSEWDEPRFSSLSPEQALHNPSAYASFAAQVHSGLLEWPREARFGAGNPRT
jgi:hypothetical protein